MSYTFSKEKQPWNYIAQGFWQGGYMPVNNLSTGYHGIMRQWWEYYMRGQDVLLVSENASVKKEFQKYYPQWVIKTLDMYPEIAHAQDIECDILGDLADMDNPLSEHSFDLIINQATLEHVYNPFGAMKNMFEALRVQGILVSHTHPPGFEYHSFPRDYFRFMNDWWEDLPNIFPDIELLELFEANNHVFSCYRRIS
jgi:SAM-dependent methyltransferase